MHVTPREIDKILLHNAGVIAQKRYARGIALNYPETVALLSAQLLEFIRDGNTVSELMDKGKGILGLEDVMPEVPAMLPEVQVEGTFPDGTKLVTIHFPLCRIQGDPDLALHGSGLSRSKKPDKEKTAVTSIPCNPAGENIVSEGEILLNDGRETVTITVLNSGDRPVQVGSHYPFFDTNPAFKFDRIKAFGMRLDIPAGTAVRFEPGEQKEVQLVTVGGTKKVFGGNGFTNGIASNKDKEAAIKALGRAGIS